MIRAAIIPARGSSMRIIGKNFKRFHGRPIICYAIETARLSGLFDMILVSTDHQEIGDIAEGEGADVVWRKYDDGTRGTQEVAREVLLEYPEIDVACVIYPTCPLLTVDQLRTGHDAYMASECDFAMSVTDPLADAGQFYWGGRDAFVDRAPLIGPRTLMIPVEGTVDINTPEDWAEAERLYALRKT